MFVENICDQNCLSWCSQLRHSFVENQVKNSAFKYNFRENINFKIFGIISSTNFNAQFSLLINNMFLNYYPRHVPSINMPIFRRKNCIHTTSGIFSLCKRLHSTLVESGLSGHLLSQPVYCADIYRERRYQMLCEYNFPPEDGHVNARNMSRIIV